MIKISDYIGEATEYDKKEILEVKRPKSWLKTVSAFANCHGGVLIFEFGEDSVGSVVVLEAEAVPERSE